MDLAEPFDRADGDARRSAAAGSAVAPANSLPLENAAITLPVPAQSVFEIPEKSLAAIAPPRIARSKRFERA